MATHYVSPTGTAAWAASVDIGSPSSLQTACANAAAGDTAVLRGGAYSRSLTPAHSGTASARIVFEAYPDERPVLTVTSDATGRWGIYLNRRDYIKVDGLTFSGCLQFYRFLGSSYNEVTRCVFQDSGTFDYSTALIADTALGGGGGVGSFHNWIHHNTFTRYGGIVNGNDLGTVRVGAGYHDPSAYNTVEDNALSYGGHDTLDIGAPFTVIKRNVIHNEEAVFADTGTATNHPASGYFGNRCLIFSNPGSRGYTGVPVHCLVEGNRLGHSGTPPDDDGAFGIENAGYHVIIRQNDIYATAGSGIYLKTSPDPSYYCSLDADAPDPHGPGSVYKSGSLTRAYNNSLYHCGFGDASIGAGFKYGVQVVGIQGATYYPPAGYCRAHPTHGYNFSLDWPWPEDVSFKNNIVFDYASGEKSFGASTAGEVTYENNFNADPGFVNPDISDPTSAVLPDLGLLPGSPCIDAGTCLARARGAGAGSLTIVVDDSKPFQDGSWGSDLARGVTMFPDWIAVGTVTNIVEVARVDYAANTITLASPATWADGDAVWLYKNSSGKRVLYGSAPDIGAHEYEGPMIIDHTTATLAAVTDADIALARETLHFAYGGASHGSQIPYGMTGLVSWSGGGAKYDYALGGGAGKLDFRFWWPADRCFGGLNMAMSLELNASAGSDRRIWEAATRTYLDAHPEVNVVMWSWCYGAATTVENINLYLSLMEGLERDYPNVKFVYMTGHANGDGLTGTTHLRNKQIRDYCVAHDKILYDFYDIECYDPDGAYFGDKNVAADCSYTGGNWALEWQAAHPGAWYPCNMSSAHTQELNGNLKAYAAWNLFTQLAKLIDQGDTPVAIDKTVSFTLEVLAPQDIFLTLDPLALAVRQGALAIYNITVQALNDFAGPVTLALEGMPAGGDYSFSVNPVQTQGASVLTIDTATLPVGGPVALVLRATA